MEGLDVAGPLPVRMHNALAPLRAMLAERENATVSEDERYSLHVFVARIDKLLLQLGFAITSALNSWSLQASFNVPNRLIKITAVSN